ncbi:hypothetical protein TTHERM_00353540 (macronuclear) [Tetrahymena thermophila SB210]|uniref:Uncharacterized protein n=1 Tax=Tetrahymena thermophila (strain SB210) TaxID=312017 RepID=I7M9V1_TETTS|nr:hypothetical protein TTHERM_00353540 [Tetrahymena thermophila SB210]EAS02865.1 hypothetical protein TTHERM_00353540 [Tetrahymena thermophila SB210]|eukprot:XP_001023110.1 hypothetical protein TTHERM_00353540 [Tetrahymena thermophila SB210]
MNFPNNSLEKGIRSTRNLYTFIPNQIEKKIIYLLSSSFKIISKFTERSNMLIDKSSCTNEKTKKNIFKIWFKIKKRILDNQLPTFELKKSYPFLLINLIIFKISLYQDPNKQNGICDSDKIISTLSKKEICKQGNRNNLNSKTIAALQYSLAIQN